MKRLHLFEFNDWRWFPFRRYLTELLTHQIATASIYAPVYALLKEALRATGYTQLLDLGSGSGGTVCQLVDWLAAHHYPVTAVMTDITPPAQPLCDQHGSITVYPFPVDILSIPPSLIGFRTLFTVFHHFRPAEAAAILQDAVNSRSAIAIFEFTERKASNVWGMLLSPIGVWIDTWQMRPRRLSRLLWTYILPVIPLVYWWDGTVSHLRTYTPVELHNLTALLDADYYEWKIGQVASTWGNITYLIGINLSHD